MKTKAEILSEKTGIELPELEYKNEVQIIRPSEALEAMNEHAQQISQEFAELLYTWESKLELLNVSIANLSEAADPNTMTTFTVLQYQQMQLTQCIEGVRPIIAKFME